MENQKRLIAINDISGFGKCSLTVALPIISANERIGVGKEILVKFKTNIII